MTKIHADSISRKDGGPGGHEAQNRHGGAFAPDAPSTPENAPMKWSSSRAFQNMLKRPHPPVYRPETQSPARAGPPPSCPLSPENKSGTYLHQDALMESRK